MKKIFIAIMTLLLVGSVILPVNIYASETIKVGYIDYDGFFIKNIDGSYSGYGVDYLEKISQYTNWNYEYIYDTFDNQLKALKEGKIDLIAHAQKTDERLENYLYSSYSSGVESSVLYVRNDADYYYNDYERFNGMKIALLEESFQNEEFDKYAKEHNFTYEPVYFGTVNSSFSALDNGEVDGVAMGSLALQSGYKVICRFGSDPFYFITGKNNHEMMNELNQALSEINTTNPYFNASLYEKFYSDGVVNNTPLFTRKEVEFINNSKVINVGLLANRIPLSYQNSNGETEGMTYELMELISQKSGLIFNYGFLSTGQTGMDYLKDENNDLVAGVMSSIFSTINPDLLQSNTLLDSTVSFVGRKGTKFSTKSELTVALPANFIHGKEVIKEVYPNFKFIEYKTTEKCIEAISKGKADILLQNIYVSRDILQRPQYNNLEIFPGYDFEESMKIVSNSDNELLMSIINKTIDCISSDEKNSIIINNTVAKTYKLSLSDIMYQYKYPIIVVSCLIVAIIALLLIVIIVRQRSLLKVSNALKRVDESNKQLEIALDKADRASNAKSSFLANMSHEIRTPMNAIVGLTRLSKNYLNDPVAMNTYLDKINVSSNLLLNIINDILDMSAIENGRLKLAHESMNLKDILFSIMTIYAPQCNQKGIIFDINVSKIQHEKLIGDSLRLNQILLNLISNAYKFTPKGGNINVTIIEEFEQKNKSYYKIIVQDTGVGMSEDMINRLFRPFEQEDASTARKHGGSGLGLSITKNLIELMHGKISVSSIKGKGSTFIVDIPFEIDNDEKDLLALDYLHVLVINDDNHLQEILKEMNIDYDIVNDLSAIDVLKINTYDICFISNTNILKEIQELQDCQIVLISLLENVEGVDYIIHKPLFQSTIYNILMKYSNQSSVIEQETIDYDFSNHRILLAEDNEINAEIAIELLSLVNLEVDHVINGQEVIEQFTSKPKGYYDLILMDVQMPIKDGYSATKEIRASNHDDAKSIPIFALTANAFDDDIALALSSGMNGHVSKPIDTDALYKVIYDTINN